MMDLQNAILVWRWEDAPAEYRALSRRGGDEDWVVFIPRGLKSEYIGWLEEGGPFGRCCVEEHGVPGGIVYIGSHA